MYVYTCVYIYMYVCICVCVVCSIYIYIYTERYMCVFLSCNINSLQSILTVIRLRTFSYPLRTRFVSQPLLEELLWEPVRFHRTGRNPGLAVTQLTPSPILGHEYPSDSDEGYDHITCATPALTGPSRSRVTPREPVLQGGWAGKKNSKPFWVTLSQNATCGFKVSLQ